MVDGRAPVVADLLELGRGQFDFHGIAADDQHGGPIREHRPGETGGAGTLLDHGGGVSQRGS